MIKYLGSKRTLLPLITSVAGSLGEVRTAGDLFSGTARVGHALKAAGYDVTANDHNSYAATLARCYVQTDARRVEADALRLLAELSGLPGSPGYFTETFCERSRFFHPRNGERIDAIRERIAALDLDPELESVLLVSLMEAADRVDSTTGVQMAYLKSWAPRALNDLELRMPRVLPGAGTALGLDAEEAAREHSFDLVYLDPPYNQHSYRGNYHVWESLVRWDKPECYGVACKRLDCRDHKSDFNSRSQALPALRRLVRAVRTRHLIVSFNDEGFVSREEMERLLADHGHLVTIEVDFKRYVGAIIGIHNPAGEKVGSVGRLRNKEFLYVVTPDATVAESLGRRFGAVTRASAGGAGPQAARPA